MTVTDPHLIPKPRRLSRRGWIFAGGVVLVLLLLYGLVAFFYNVEGGSTFVGADPNATSGVVIYVEPTSVDAGKNVGEIHLTFNSNDDAVLDQDRHLVQNTRVTVLTIDGMQEYRFPAGSVFSQQVLNLALDGEEALYPFDNHAGSATFAVDTYTKNSDGSVTSSGQVYSTLAPSPTSNSWGINGWDTLLVADDKPGSSNLDITYTRAFSTRAFALLLLVLVMILAAIALLVGLLVSTRRRRAEVGLMAYAASLLFALPALRGYMPNAPPIGAALDIYVYLWVIVLAIVALSLVVLAWLNQTRRVLLFEREQAKEAWQESHEQPTPQQQTGD